MIRSNEYSLFDAHRRCAAAGMFFVCGATIAGTAAQPISDIRVREIMSLEGTEIQAFYRGRPISPVHTIKPLLRLENLDFDPVQGVPHVAPEFRAVEGASLKILQFKTMPLQLYWDAIREKGIRVHGAIPDRACLVTASAEESDWLQQQEFTRALVDMHPAYKVDGETRRLLMTKDGPEFDATVLLAGSGHDTRAEAMKLVDSINGKVISAPHNASYLLVSLRPEQARVLLRSDLVLYLEESGEVENYLDVAREYSGANWVETLPGYRGEGVRGEVSDTAIELTHPEFIARSGSDPAGPHLAPLVHTPNGSTGMPHGTSVYGTIFSAGVDPQAEGIIPLAQGIWASQFAVRTNRAMHTCELADPLAPYRAVFQSNSWAVGSSPATNPTRYTGVASVLDEITLQTDVLQFQAMGNQGLRVANEANAKNVVSIGGVIHRDSVDRIFHFWGDWPNDPANTLEPGHYPETTGEGEDIEIIDRIKPDLIHFYDNVYTTTTGASYTPVFGGTSVATPLVAGHAGLMFEMYGKEQPIGSGVNLFGNSIDPTQDVFGNRPSAATGKALLINTAYQYDWTSPAHSTLTRRRQGWGVPDVRTLYLAGAWGAIEIIDEEDALVPPFGPSVNFNQYTVNVMPSDLTLHITMVYTDPPGLSGSRDEEALVNNLDLVVISPSGTTYRGNYGLSDGLWSLPGGAADSANNVENVFIQYPESGAWTVRVLGTDISQDARFDRWTDCASAPPTSDGIIDADYALIMRRGYCPSDYDQNGVVNANDVTAFNASHNASEPRADYNGDGMIDFDDVLSFLSNFGIECASD